MFVPLFTVLVIPVRLLTRNEAYFCCRPGYSYEVQKEQPHGVNSSFLLTSINDLFRYMQKSNTIFIGRLQVAAALLTRAAYMHAHGTVRRD